MNNKKKLKSGN